MSVAYIPRGPSIHYHPWLMCFKLHDRQPKHPFRSINTKSSQKHWNLTNIGPISGLVNANTIRDTFKHTTQWGVSISTFPMKKHLKSRNPALNVPRRHEAVATDTVYSDTPAVDSGVKQAQLFVGKESLVSDIYPMRSGKQFVNTLEGNIHRHNRKCTKTL